jgi:hypothetical protein
MENKLQMLKRESERIALLCDNMSGFLSVAEGLSENRVNEAFDHMYRNMSDMVKTVKDIQLAYIRERRTNRRAQRREQPLLVRTEVLRVRREEPLVRREEPLVRREEPLVRREEPLVRREEPLVRREEPLRARSRPKIVVVKVPRAVLREMMSESCGICLETRTREKTITTSCGHPYCGNCFRVWSSYRVRSKCIVSCPICVSPVFEITRYTAIFGRNQGVRKFAKAKP